MRYHSHLRYVVCIALVLSACFSVWAQTDQELGEATKKAVELFSQERFAEAAPQFAIVVKAIPDEPKIRFMYGFCLVAQSKQTQDVAEAKQIAALALEQFVKAKELGLESESNDYLIATLSGKAVPTAEPAYSKNKDAEQLMVEAESAFAQANYDEAIKKYDKALALDPKIYMAATGGGDSYVAKSDWANAEKWYQRAIAIDPDRETAYRYSGTPLMKQQKFDEARERYIEAYITEPYNSMSARGIGQWADATGAKLGHPAVDVPAVTFDAAGKAVPKVAIDPADANAKPWLAYFATREAWKKGKFAKTFPAETAYRHSLQEESEALRAAITAAKTQKSPNAQFDMLAKMDAEGVLDAFVLISKPDREVAKDHPGFLKNNRPKLRLYVANYLIHK